MFGEDISLRRQFTEPKVDRLEIHNAPFGNLLPNSPGRLLLRRHKISQGRFRPWPSGFRERSERCAFCPMEWPAGHSIVVAAKVAGRLKSATVEWIWRRPSPKAATQERQRQICRRRSGATVPRAAGKGSIGHCQRPRRDRPAQVQCPRRGRPNSTIRCPA